MRVFVLPMVRDAAMEAADPVRGRLHWTPKYLGDTFSDLRHTSMGNARRFMICRVEVVDGGDVAQLDALASQADVVELIRGKKTITAQKRESLRDAAAKASMDLAAVSSEDEMIESLCRAIEVKHRTQTRGEKELERDTLLAELNA